MPEIGMVLFHFDKPYMTMQSLKTGTIYIYGNNDKSNIDWE